MFISAEEARRATRKAIGKIVIKEINEIQALIKNAIDNDKHELLFNKELYHPQTIGNLKGLGYNIKVDEKNVIIDLEGEN